MHGMESAEIDVAPIHDVDGTGLRLQQVEDMHIGHLAIGDVDEAKRALTYPRTYARG